MKRSMILAAMALLFGVALGGRSVAADSPYATLPSQNDNVRFDGSAGGETRAWAYPKQDMLGSYLRGTIDASYGTTTYDAYQRKMSTVLANSLDFPNGTTAVVLYVERFTYRGHEDVEVKARVTAGQFHPIVWTTPAELVSSSGHRYLR